MMPLTDLFVFQNENMTFFVDFIDDALRFRISSDTDTEGFKLDLAEAIKLHKVLTDFIAATSKKYYSDRNSEAEALIKKAKEEAKKQQAEWEARREIYRLKNAATREDESKPLIDVNTTEQTVAINFGSVEITIKHK